MPDCFDPLVDTPDITRTPWRTVKGAAERAQAGVKTIYKEIHAGRLRAARIGNRRDIRIHVDWIDAWLEASAEKQRKEVA